MSMRKIQTLVLLLLASGYAPAQTGPEALQFASGERRVAMIELYTSEGCNSCPPADRWLGRLKQHPGLWSRFVPAAFHVDYWDYIGWTDRFARPEYSERQRQYAAEGGVRFVYTPGMFHDGLEWNGWRRGGPVYSVTETVGNLRLRVDGRAVTLQFDAASEAYEGLRAHVAVLGMNLETRVSAGENAGKTLGHDFVVLDLRAVPLSTGNGGYTAELALRDVKIYAPEQAIIAWVSEADRQAPVQAVGGYLPPIDGR